MSVRRGSKIIAGIPIVDGALNTASTNPIANAPVANAIIDLSGRIDDITGGSDLVHKSQDEEITGEKTFTKSIQVITSDSSVQTLITKKDADNNKIGSLEAIGGNGNNYSTIKLSAFSGDGTDSGVLGVNYGNGNPYAYAPTPSSTHWNDNKVATTAWVKSLLGNHYVVAWQAPTAANDHKWYRLYADNWVEQGQYINTANKTITFPITMADTDYCLVGVGFCIANYGRQSVSKATTGFTTSSAVQQCETNGYACFGMAAAQS